jgi:hypothetical protein
MSVTRLPAPRVAPAVEAGDYHGPMLLHLEEYAIREAAHPRTAGVPMDERELQRVRGHWHAVACALCITSGLPVIREGSGVERGFERYSR